MHTYIIGHYNPSVRITALLAKPLMLYLFILYVSDGTYSFFRNFFMADLFTLRVFVKNQLRGKSRTEIFFFSYFGLMSALGYEPGLYV